MIQTIWLMWKPGEERKYAMCVQPPKVWADKQKTDGFYIASFEVELPDDPANFKLGTVVGNVLVSRELRIEYDPEAPVVKLERLRPCLKVGHGDDAEPEIPGLLEYPLSPGTLT